MRAFALLISMPLMWAAGGRLESILVPGKDWELLGQDYQLTADSAVLKDGTVYFTDSRRNRIHQVDPNGTITVWKAESGGAHGIAAGPDGRLYAGQHERKRIVAFDGDGRESIVAGDVQTHHLTITKRGQIYLADGPHHTIWLMDASGNKRAATTDLNWPHGLKVSPGQSRLFVTDTHVRWVWVFQIQRDGSLTNGHPFYRLETPQGAVETDAGGMTFDTKGFLYAATSMGVQVFDQGRHLAGIIQGPGAPGVSNVFFGGRNMQWLYVTDGQHLYRRLLNRRGAPPF